MCSLHTDCQFRPHKKVSVRQTNHSLGGKTVPKIVSACATYGYKNVGRRCTACEVGGSRFYLQDQLWTDKVVNTSISLSKNILFIENSSPWLNGRIRRIAEFWLASLKGDRRTAIHCGIRLPPAITITVEPWLHHVAKHVGKP